MTYSITIPWIEYDRLMDINYDVYSWIKDQGGNIVSIKDEIIITFPNSEIAVLFKLKNNI